MAGDEVGLLGPNIDRIQVVGQDGDILRVRHESIVPAGIGELVPVIYIAVCATAPARTPTSMT